MAVSAPEKEGVGQVNRKTVKSASAGKIGRNRFPADEEEEYRVFGGYLPAAEPGRHVQKAKQRSDLLHNLTGQAQWIASALEQDVYFIYSELEELINVWNCWIYRGK